MSRSGWLAISVEASYRPASLGRVFPSILFEYIWGQVGMSLFGLPEDDEEQFMPTGGK